MRKAFLMASNGPERFGTVKRLRYAMNDLHRVASCLTHPQYGFEIQSPRLGSQPQEVIDHLREAIEGCQANDHLIIYFSGHGVLDRTGALVLLWDDSNMNKVLTSTINVTDIMRALELCDARNKLLILDCCHAGAFINMAGLKGGGDVDFRQAIIAPDNYLVYMASGRHEMARELEKSEGSFFTSHICDALTTRFNTADIDGDGKLSLTELAAWINEEAIEHNSHYPEFLVPYPYLFGKQRGEFFFNIGLDDWQPYELQWPNGGTMVVLPRIIGTEDGSRLAFAMAKHPVTNAQFREFLNHHSGVTEPVGEQFIDGSWHQNFFPWRDPQYNKDEQPVVCITFNDALNYCSWINKLLREQGTLAMSMLPTPSLWNFGAYGGDQSPRDPRVWLRQTRHIHQAAECPAPIESTSLRQNKRGLSDMVGNVWEWCAEFDERARFSVAIPRPIVELKGGSFLDNLGEIEPTVSSTQLDKGENTVHSDIGFRIASVVSIESLPDPVRLRLPVAVARQDEIENFVIASHEWESHIMEILFSMPD